MLKSRPLNLQAQTLRLRARTLILKALVFSYDSAKFGIKYWYINYYRILQQQHPGQSSRNLHTTYHRQINNTLHQKKNKKKQKNRGYSHQIGHLSREAKSHTPYDTSCPVAHYKRTNSPIHSYVDYVWCFPTTNVVFPV